MPRDCAHCDDYRVCTGEECTIHPLYKYVYDMERSYDLWGDTMIEEDAAVFNALSDEEKKKKKNANAKEHAKAERKIKEAFKENTISANRTANCVTVNGKLVLKHKFKLECKNEDMPDETLSDGSKFSGGCWANEKGYCPFMHKDEKDKYDFKGAKRILLITSKPHSASRNTRNKGWRGGKRKTRKH